MNAELRSDPSELVAIHPADLGQAALGRGLFTAEGQNRIGADGPDGRRHPGDLEAKAAITRPLSALTATEIARLFDRYSRKSAARRIIKVLGAGSWEDADGFWRLYRRILARKVSDAVDRQNAMKRGGPGTGTHLHRPESKATTAPGAAMAVPPDDLDLFQSGLPSAEVEAIGKETTERLVGLLQPDLQRVVLMRVDGHTIYEIAVELRVSTRSVDRMLKMIRSTWMNSSLADGITLPKGRLDGKRSSPT